MTQLKYSGIFECIGESSEVITLSTKNLILYIKLYCQFMQVMEARRKEPHYYSGTFCHPNLIKASDNAVSRNFQNFDIFSIAKTGNIQKLPLYSETKIIVPQATLLPGWNLKQLGPTSPMAFERSRVIATLS